MNPVSHLLDIKGLKTHFRNFEATARAVDDVSFHMNAGETVGLVGESGCGKSVTALSLMRLIKDPPGRIVGGEILFSGGDLLRLTQKEMRTIRGNRISMIFQEPMTSLNPVCTIGDQIAEMFVFHRKLRKKEAMSRAVEMLRKVQIPTPEKRVYDYPHQMSGGMRQRAMIAMALSLEPEILIADEPTTALDVTIQAQIIDLMLQLKENAKAAILMITHDLGVIAETAQRIVVMYAGRILEEGRTAAILEDPKHPYTRGLLRSVPRIGMRTKLGKRRLREIPGVVPSLYAVPEGCSFHPRCPEARDVCRAETLPLTDLGDDHRVRCRIYGDGWQ